MSSPAQRRAAQQDQHGAAAARVARRFAVGQHFVPVCEPAAHLALQHRLAIGGGESLAVDRRARNGYRGARLEQEIGERIVGLVVVIPCRSISACTAQCPRRSFARTSCRGRGAGTSARLVLLPDVPRVGAGSARICDASSASRSSAMRCRGIGAGGARRFAARLRAASASHRRTPARDRRRRRPL